MEALTGIDAPAIPHLSKESRALCLCMGAGYFAARMRMGSGVDWEVTASAAADVGSESDTMAGGAS